MKARFALALVVPFAGGLLLTAGVGGALGVFDRGPTLADVESARERGRSEAAEQVDILMAGEEQATAESGYQRGREASEFPYLDRVPNPDSWFMGVMAGREAAEARAAATRFGSAQEAWEAGFADGHDQGIDEALGVVRPPVRADEASGERRPYSFE